MTDNIISEKKCPQCNQALTQVGQFFVCPEHGQMSVDKPFVPLRIFLSYGHDSNEELVRLIKRDLGKRGHEVWFDKNEIKGGYDWRRSITDGIMSSNRVLSFLSKHSTRDPGVCLDEIAIAIGAKGGNIQTILVESEQEVTPPTTVSHIQWLDMHDWKKYHSAGDAEWGKWYQTKLDEIVSVVESEESRQFAGEIEKLNGYLKPISSDTRISSLLSKGFVGREWLTDKVETWRIGKNRDSRLLWITGAPGVGKSAFAANLSHYGRDTIIASQFCEWDKTDHRDAKRVICSIAFQLASRLPDYRKLLLTNPEIATVKDKDVSDLFTEVLAEPLGSVIDGGREQYLILIDALDEAAEKDRNPLADMLARDAQRLPDWLGLIITSRPEKSVTVPLQGLKPYILDTATETNRNDIRLYLREKLEIGLKDRSDGGSIVEQILKKSEGVFLYVERVCADIDKGYLSLDCLDAFPEGLGEVFWQFFERQFPDQQMFKRTILPALRAILAAREPLSMEILQVLFGWHDEELREFTRTLGSLFLITKQHGKETIRPYHKSIIDWLDSEDKAGPYYVSIREGHLMLAKYGYEQYKTNLGALHSYFVRNLPSHLIYSQMWGELESLLTDLMFVQAKCEAGMADDMLVNYNAAFDVMPVSSQNCIQAFQQVFSQELHNIRQRPDLTFQQMYNQLQWRNGCPKDLSSGLRLKYLENGGKFLRQFRIPKFVKSHLLMTLTGHSSSVYFCCYSPDGLRIASASADKNLKIWDANTGNEILTLIGHSKSVRFCSYSPDGHRIVSANNDKTLKIWDVETGKDLHTLVGHTESVRSCCYSPDGRHIVSASDDNTLKIWDAKRGKEILALTGHNDSINSCCYSPDGRWILSASNDSTLKIWDAETGQVVTTLTKHSNVVESCCYSSDGRYIVSASWDSTLKIWDAATGEEIITLTGHSNAVESCCLSPDGRCIVSIQGEGNILKIWDFETGKELRTLTEHSNVVESCCYSPDGHCIVSAGGDDETLKIWDAKKGRDVASLSGHSGSIKFCHFSPDGCNIVTASTDRTLKIWDAETGKEIQVLSGHGNVVASCCYSPDGIRIASASWDKTLRIWDAETGKEIFALTGHGNWLTCCSYSPDGRRIVSASWDGTLKIWDLEIGKEITTLIGHSNRIASCCYSPDGGRIVSASWDKTLKIWDAETGKEIITLIGHKNVVESCSCSPDGRRIASASWDGTLKIWDAKTGKEIKTLTGNSDRMKACSYSLDGLCIVSASWDNTFGIWNTETGKEIATFLCENSVETCVFASCGESIGCGDSDGNFYIIKPEGFTLTKESPFITATRLWEHDRGGSFASVVTTTCPYCSKRFDVQKRVLDTISSINKKYEIGPKDSPCTKLPQEAWDDPGLLSECPECGKALRFNPFVVDNQTNRPEH